MSGVGIIGGGLLGLGLADKLSADGVRVTVYESAATLGGLAGSTLLGGVRVDRYYHAVTTDDTRVLTLASELGLDVRGRQLGVGFYHQGRHAEMSTPAQLLTFPGLSPLDRARLVRFVLRCKQISGTQRSVVAVVPFVARHFEQRLLRGSAKDRIPGRRSQQRRSAAEVGGDNHRRTRPLQDQPVGADEDHVARAVSLGVPQRGHVHRIGQCLGAREEPRHVGRPLGREAAGQRHRRDPAAARVGHPGRHRADSRERCTR